MTNADAVGRVVIGLALTLGPLLAIAAARSVYRMIAGTIRAEREWTEASRRLPPERQRLIDAIIAEQIRMMTTGVPSDAGRRRQLIKELTDTIVALHRDAELSQNATDRIVYVLREAWGAGHLSYAEKLAREAVKARRDPPTPRRATSLRA